MTPARRAALVLLALVLAAPASPQAVPAARPLASPARARFLAMFARAYYPGRSGQVMVVARRGDVVTRPGPEVMFMHGSPWDYDTRIPLIVWGRGRIRPGMRAEAVSQEEVAPTLAKVLGIALPAATGHPLTAILRPSLGKPKAVVLLVLDAFRADYLDRPGVALPNLQRLREEGASFTNARVTHLPTITAVGHATIATGAEPRIHGIVANSAFDRVSGTKEGPFDGLSPRNLMAPTLADAWNAETDGRAVILAQTGNAGASAVAGHGACTFNGRPTVYATYDSSTGGWRTNPECFRLPGYLASANVRTVWEPRGGTWRGHDIASTDVVRRSAPFVTFEGDSLVSMIEQEPLGADAVPDLVIANFKVADYVAHAYGPDSPETREALEALDAQIGRVTAALDAKVGHDGYVLAITADHGMPPEPPPGHARRYAPDIVRALHEKLDPAGKLISLYESESSQLYVDRARLAELGLTLAKVRDALQAMPFVEAAFTEDEVRAAAR